jgi:peroxiredoxin
LRSFERNLREFESRGVQIAAISVDSPRESSDLARSQGYTFPLLCDPDMAAIRAYGVLHQHGGEHGQDIARPAEFLVDRSGTIRWVNLTENVLARLRPQTVLGALDDVH